MFFLPTIEEDDETEELMQVPRRGGPEESDEPSIQHGIRSSRHETDSEYYKTYTEKERSSQEKHGDRNSSIGVAPGDQRKPHDQLNKTLSSRRSSSSTPRKRNSSTAWSPNIRSTSIQRSLRRMSSTTPERSQRRTSSARRPRSSSAPPKDLGSRSTEHISDPVVGKSEEQMTSKRRVAPRRRRRPHPTSEHDDLPAPQWIINLMFDIEEATRHDLTMEEK